MLKFKMLHATVLVLLLFLGHWCQAAGDLNDIEYSFDKQKLAAAKDPLQFLRSYVDYYYLLMQKNRSQLPTLNLLGEFSGWCVGDAHPENFGVLLQQDGFALFAMNDLDDSGPCPLALDLLRLMTSARLYSQDVKVQKIFESYLGGLQGLQFPTPPFIKDMLQKGIQKGFPPNPKKIAGQKLIRDSQMNEVGLPEQGALQQLLTTLPLKLNKKFKILDLVSTTKIGGGSGGLLRYEVLINNGGPLLHLELKEQIRPSIYPVAVGPIPETTSRIRTGLQMTQGKKVSSFYQVINWKNKSMLIRPRFAGNISVDLKDQSLSENNELIYFEAFQLGAVHARSLIDIKRWFKVLKVVSLIDLNEDVSKTSRQFEKKFSELKN